MRVAVLGATGFVGRSLVPALAEHAEVVAVSRRGGTPDGDAVRAVAADATDATAMQRALEGTDVVGERDGLRGRPDPARRDHPGLTVDERDDRLEGGTA